MSRPLILSALLLCALAAGCQPDADDETFEFETMGTIARGKIEMWDRTLKRSPSEMIHACFDSVEARLSHWDDASEVGRLNALPADTTVTLSPWLSECLRVSGLLNQVSDGAFDPTAGPLMHLWGFHRRQGRLPSAAQIDSARALMGGYTHDPFRRTLTKSTAGTTFDLGGIAKGFAVDRAVANLREMGISNALVDLGGNLFCLGKVDDRHPWRVGIKDPRDSRRLIATFEIVNRAVATSGAYERFVTIDGERYGHIMNPATGRPAHGLLSVTVICRSATLADGLSTTLYVLGPEAATTLLNERYPNLEAVLIVPDDVSATDKLIVTSGLRGNLTLLPEYRDRYTVEYMD